MGPRTGHSSSWETWGKEAGFSTHISAGLLFMTHTPHTPSMLTSLVQAPCLIALVIFIPWPVERGFSFPVSLFQSEVLLQCWGADYLWQDCENYPLCVKVHIETGQQPPTASSTVAPPVGRPGDLFSPTFSTLAHCWQFLSKTQLSLLTVCLLFLNHLLPPWNLNSNQSAKLGMCLRTCACSQILRELRSFMKILWQRNWFSFYLLQSQIWPHQQHFIIYAKNLVHSKHSEGSYNYHPESELSAVWSSEDTLSWALCNA